jgi:hypothetical protein
MRLAQDRMAVTANVHRCNITYNVGDMVDISTKTITAGTEIAKFKVRWMGPYKYSNNAIRMHIRLTFHTKWLLTRTGVPLIIIVKVPYSTELCVLCRV